MIFQTERLDVGPWTHDDAERVFDIYSQWEVARRLGATPRALVEPGEAHAAVDRWAGRSTEDVLSAYPYLEREDIQAALAYAAWRSEEIEVPLKAS